LKDKIGNGGSPTKDQTSHAKNTDMHGIAFGRKEGVREELE
jgi:hypothetical protein